MNLETFTDLYCNVLQDLYDAEHQILTAWPKMATAAFSAKLQEGFEGHWQQTQSHIERLNQVFHELGEPSRRKKCKGIEDLLEEGKELLESDSGPEMLDVALIAVAQKVEHYEIAAYGCARTYAEKLGQEAAVEWLQQTLDEEKQTDEKLTEIAMSEIQLESDRTVGGILP
jgi:ferritin-like metal-binding protein YciE